MRYTILIVAVLAALFCRLFLVSVYKVSSQTMAPGLLAGDFILATKTAYGLRLPWSDDVYFNAKPKRGDLVVFKKKSKIYIKRVLAVPHDEIESANGEYNINGDKCQYDLIKNLTAETENNSYSIFSEKCGDLSYNIIRSGNAGEFIPMAKVKINDSEVFVVSDHRSFKSNDSDPNIAETISINQIIGKPVLVWMSYSSAKDFISNTSGFRWNRILTNPN